MKVGLDVYGAARVTYVRGEDSCWTTFVVRDADDEEITTITVFNQDLNALRGVPVDEVLS